MTEKRRWLSDETIDNWTNYHEPTGGKIALHGHIRDSYRNLMKWLNEVLPESPEKTTALVQARNAMQAANTCVALHPLDPDVEAAYVQPGIVQMQGDVMPEELDVFHEAFTQRIAPVVDSPTQLMPHVRTSESPLG